MTNLNRRAGELLSADPIQSINRHVRQSMTSENYQIFSNFVKSMRDNKLNHLQKEIRVDIDGESGDELELDRAWDNFFTYHKDAEESPKKHLLRVLQAA